MADIESGDLGSPDRQFQFRWDRPFNEYYDDFDRFFSRFGLKLASASLTLVGVGMEVGKKLDEQVDIDELYLNYVDALQERASMEAVAVEELELSLVSDLTDILPRIEIRYST